MAYDTTIQSVLFQNLSKKAVTVKFDQDHASSDGGAVLLKACDQKLKLSSTLASCLSDDRQQSKVTHSLEELFRQRLFAIACGYADGNDAARLADDPVMKLLAGRDPIAGGSLALSTARREVPSRAMPERSFSARFRLQNHLLIPDSLKTGNRLSGIRNLGVNAS